MTYSNSQAIEKLFQEQFKRWQTANREIFGLDAEHSYNELLERYWVSGTNCLKEKLLQDVFLPTHEFNKDSWILEEQHGTVVLSGLFGANKIKKKIAILPIVTDLGYTIRDVQYALRIKADYNNYLIKKRNGKIKISYKDKDDKKKYATFFNGKWEDGQDHYKNIKDSDKPYLAAIVKADKLTKKNYKEAFEKMPEYDAHSTSYFTFVWTDMIKNMVKFSKQKIKLLQWRPIAYINLLKKQSYYGDTNKAFDFVIVESDLEALVATREVSFIRKVSGHIPAFYFTDTLNLFDVYKTPTSQLAGRNRLLLDNIYVEDNTLKTKTKKNQWEIIFGMKPKKNFSCLSVADYNSLNDAKRIMMLSKHRAQALPVMGQSSDLTHAVDSRVLFADIEAYNDGDSVIISESFAKKLETRKIYTFKLRKSVDWHPGDKLTSEDLLAIDYRDRYRGWDDIEVVKTTKYSCTVTFIDRFNVGDKLSNYHGSKGIVSLILPDDEMPYLKNDLSPLMPAGPMDVIVSGLSVYKRKSLGQLFEAAARALDLGELPLDKLIMYSKDIEKFDKNSIFVFKEKEFQAPCGINSFIRLNHDAWSKISMSPSYSFKNKSTLHLAEMEMLNLASRGYINILQETANRDITHNPNAVLESRFAQQTALMNYRKNDLTRLQRYMNFLGYNLEVSEEIASE